MTADPTIPAAAVPPAPSAAAAGRTPPAPRDPDPVGGAGGLVITVHGTPAPQGSKRHVGHGKMVESSKKVKPWRESVKWAALEAMGGTPAASPHDGYYAVEVSFYLPRPRSHYRTGKNAHELRVGAPRYVSKRPDIDKLIRSTFDALGEAGCWIDDAQVAILTARKRYADNQPPGATIRIYRVTT